jgi:ATP-binding cassette subfamily F protein 3
MLRLEDVSLTVGTKELLVGAELHVRPNERVGLVGANGTGKTSLLRLMIGELQPEAGRVHRRGGVKIGYLPQRAVSGSTRTVWEEAASHMHDIVKLQATLDAAQAGVERDEQGAIERLDAATEAFRIAGGFSVEERIGSVLHGLGFGPDAWRRTCDTFSGGWQMRIALARLLLSAPDLMLLDEPTNHLDLRARSWLAQYLEAVRGTVVVVSHDRHLLDRATTNTVEVRHKRLHGFRGNLSAWLLERAQREHALEVARGRQQEEIARLQRFVDRFGAKATKASQAKSKQKQIDRIEEIDAPQRDPLPRLQLPEAPGCAREVLVLHEASAGWEPGVDVLRKVSLVLERGQRLAVLGPNGCGKSTLLHALAGTLPLSAGRRRVGKDVLLGVFRQDLAQALPPDLSAIEHVQAIAPAVLPQRVRSALGALGLGGDAALRRIGDLSGGEKARVVLATFVVRPFNVLLLDEPTNHLDAITVEVLLDALEQFEGAVLLVTHDRYLVERLATHVAVVSGGGVEIFEGVRPEHLEPAPVSTSKPATTEHDTVGLDQEERKQRRRERTKLQRRFEKASAELSQAEAEMAAIEQQILAVAGDYVRAGALDAKRRAAEARAEALFEELAELETALVDDGGGG